LDPNKDLGEEDSQAAIEYLFDKGVFKLNATKLKTH
jgi:hypothetical protein